MVVLVLPAHALAQRTPELMHQASRAARATNIPLPIALRLIQSESSWRPHAVSPVGAIGLTQVMPATGRAICGMTRATLRRTWPNLYCGLHYLSLLYRRFGSWDRALMAYHRGPTRLAFEMRHGINHGSSVKYAQGILSGPSN